MIMKLDFSEVVDSAVRTTNEDGKQTNLFMRVNVDRTNVEQAIARLRGNKWVVCLEYTDDLVDLDAIDTSGILVIKQFEASELTEAFVAERVKAGVRSVFKVPKEFSDMRLIQGLSIKYPTAYFCGGTFLKIEGCNLGTITQDDIFKKVRGGSSIVSVGCSCVAPTVHIDEMGEDIEFYNDPKASTIKEEKVKKSKFSVDKVKVPKEPKVPTVREPKAPVVKEQKPKVRFGLEITKSLGTTNNF